MRDDRLDNRPTAPEEQKLINAGIFLWRYRKEWPEPGISLALEAIWAAKEEIRRPLRATWLEAWEKQKERLVEVRAKRASRP